MLMYAHDISTIELKANILHFNKALYNVSHTVYWCAGVFHCTEGCIVLLGV